MTFHLFGTWWMNKKTNFIVKHLCFWKFVHLCTRHNVHTCKRCPITHSTAIKQSGAKISRWKDAGRSGWNCWRTCHRLDRWHFVRQFCSKDCLCVWPFIRYRFIAEQIYLLRFKGRKFNPQMLGGSGVLNTPLMFELTTRIYLWSIKGKIWVIGKLCYLFIINR